MLMFFIKGLNYKINEGGYKWLLFLRTFQNLKVN